MKNSFKYSVLFFLLLFLVGCSTNATPNDTEKVMITTEKGDIEVNQSPKNIVVFDYVVVDFLMKHNLEFESIGAVETSAPDYQKEYLSGAAEIGGLKAPDMEKIAALNPEVIFIGGRTIDFYDELSKIAPVVYLTADNNQLVDSIKENNLKLARIFNLEEETQTMLNSLEEQLASLPQDTSKTLVLMYNEGQLSSFSKGSRFGFIYDLFGYTEMEPDLEVASHGVDISYEYIAQKKPEVIFLINRNLIHGGNVEIDSFYNHPLIKDLEFKLIELDPNTIYQVGSGLLSFEKTITEILNKQ